MRNPPKLPKPNRRLLTTLSALNVDTSDSAAVLEKFDELYRNDLDAEEKKRFDGAPAATQAELVRHWVECYGTGEAPDRP